MYLDCEFRRLDSLCAVRKKGNNNSPETITMIPIWKVGEYVSLHKRLLFMIWYTSLMNIRQITVLSMNGYDKKIFWLSVSWSW